MLDRFYKARAELIDNRRLPDTGQPVPDDAAQINTRRGLQFEQVATDVDPAAGYPDDWSNPPPPPGDDWQGGKLANDTDRQRVYDRAKTFVTRVAPVQRVGIDL